ncbi:Kelch repeat-containing protein [Bacillus swezeyi]|uniref:Attractin/MKLN-like beta-propeller domain-containing protein n=1 Tax=Bacillus swezeyi TaxID=1925020 RepID=A0A5M8RHY4_9BACI|nr:kelch repeat-containing protein [Bacillus swezeyi]KAA6447809.1 hypothetical protein DX927_21460 [Bacillus swezeyi]TYS34395.1 hypothetical protein FZC77_18430 [Bacillus swezeyi]
MKTKFLFALMIIIFASLTAYAPAKAEEKNDTYEWVDKANLPEALYGAVTAVADEKIYVIGGGKNDQVTNHTYVYDPQNDTWTQKSDMPTARKGAAFAVVDGKIYVIGGFLGKTSYTNKVEVYNPKTDTWETAPDLPQHKAIASASAIGNNIYVIGGHTAERPNLSDKNFCYNTETKTWTEKKSLPIDLEYLTTSTANGKVYAIGGFSNLKTNKIIYEYDPSSDSWNKKNNLITGYIGSSSTAVNGKIYIIGGNIPGKNGSDLVQVYDPADDSIKEFKSINHARSFSGVVSIKDDIYVIGGAGTVSNFKYGNNQDLNSVEMLSLDGNTKTPSQPEEPQNDNHRAKLIITMITGLEKEYDLPMKEVNDFINWYDQKDAGIGLSRYAINVYDDNGPYVSRKDHVIFNNILMFQVNEYETSKSK